ncbi:class I SAM-dependent methyltransferase [Chloroflexota bacterium]
MAFYYTEVSKTYDMYRSFRDSQIDSLIEFAGIVESDRVLDIGCGTGNASARIAEKVHVDILGVDRSIQMLEIAVSKSLEVLCVDVDNSRLPFRDRSFDIVLGTYMIHYINNPDFLFSECFRVLRNGTLIFLTSSHEQIDNENPVENEFFPSLAKIDKERFPDIPRIYELFASAGFGNVEHKEVRIEDDPLDLNFLQKVKAKYISTYHLIPQREFESGVKKLERYIRDLNEPQFREWQGTLIRGSKVIG